MAFRRVGSRCTAQRYRFDERDPQSTIGVQVAAETWLVLEGGRKAEIGFVHKARDTPVGAGRRTAVGLSHSGRWARSSKKDRGLAGRCGPRGFHDAVPRGCACH